MKYADLTSSTSHVEISAILQNKCPTLTHIIYTFQEVLCKMFKTLLSYAQFIIVRSTNAVFFSSEPAQQTFPRGFDRNSCYAGYGLKSRGTSQRHVALDQAPHVRKREEKIIVREKQSLSEASRPIV